MNTEEDEEIEQPSMEEGPAPAATEEDQEEDEEEDEEEEEEVGLPPHPSQKQQPPHEQEDDVPRIMLKGLEGLTLEGLQLFKKRMIEDTRMDSIFRSKENLQEKFDNRAYLHPHGMTDFDYKSIPESRRQGFEKFKHKTRHENWKYLGEHYDLDSMLGLFLKKLLAEKPLDPVHFAADYFTTDILAPDYEEMLAVEKCKLSNYRVAKMKAAGKIYTTELRDLDKEPPKIYERCFKKANRCPKTPSDTGLVLPIVEEVVEIKEPEITEPVKKFYCGCKDPGRYELNHPKIEVPPPIQYEDDDSDDDDSLGSTDSEDSIPLPQFVPKRASVRKEISEVDIIAEQFEQSQVQPPEQPQKDGNKEMENPKKLSAE